MSYQTILLTGIPRSGSTLCCHLLNSYRNTLALHEPMKFREMHREDGIIGACRTVSEFAFFSRRRALHDATAITKHRQGVVPDNPVQTDDAPEGLRQEIVKGGTVALNERCSRDFHLIIKHNALFTALLPDLLDFFPCYGVIRNPLAVLASWSTVELPVNRGHIPAGEWFCSELQRQLQQQQSVIDRQLVILDWFFSRFQVLPPTNIIRYEELIASHHRLLAPLSYNSAYRSSVENLVSRNTNSVYRNAPIDALFEALKNHQGCWRGFYSFSKVEALYELLTSGRDVR